jgi:superfamily II DNA or RNA helicase
LDEIRGEFAAGRKKLLLHLATGGGKTVVFSEILKGAYEKGSHALVCVRGRKIVDQAHKRLERENVPHGVMMNGHKAYRPSEKIQVCSIDTVMSRSIRPRADIVVVDEAHMAVSESFKEFLYHYKDKFILGVTATPFQEKSLRHIADHVVYPIKISDLIDQEFLVDGRYFAPSTPDLSGIAVSRATNDYVVNELAEKMSESALVGDLVTEWKQKAVGMATLCFCVNVQHSKMVCETFKAAGIAAEHVDADASDNERQAVINRLESGVTKIVCSIGTMTTGVDIPFLRCIVFARPTKSYNLYVQMLGRGTRPFPGKDRFLVLDHAGNVTRHGTFRQVDLAVASIDGKPNIPKLRTTTCSACTVCE